MPGHNAGAGIGVLTFALGTYPHTKAIKSGAIRSERLRFVFPDFSTISRAFAPMVRDGAFDISEMALATFLQAKAYGKNLVLLPVVTAARFQQAALVCRAGSDIDGLKDLIGRRIGVRSYSQTTGVWLRGCLADETGITPGQMRWLTQEGAHVLEYRDPPWVEQLSPDANLTEMLHEGRIDAMVVGNDFVANPAFRPVISNLAGSIAAFWARNEFIPVNHVVTIAGAAISCHPELPAELMKIFQTLPFNLRSGGHECRAFGRAAVQPSIDLMMRYMRAQELLPPAFDPAMVWEGLPRDIA